MPGGPTLSRRELLRAGAVGGVTLAAGAALKGATATANAKAHAELRMGLVHDLASSARTYDFNRDWLFGGQYVSGSEAPGYSDSGFTTVVTPHTVTPLSWGNWNPSEWEQQWIYRKHFEHAAVAGGRVFVDFQGVMTTATVYLGGVQVAKHQGGYLPFSVELTPHLAAGDNVLAVVVDATWQQVPPDGKAGGPGYVDYLQPGGIYRDVALRVVPEVFLSDVFAKPINALSSSPGVEIQATIDAASVPKGPLKVTAEVLDGATPIGSAATTVSLTEVGATVATFTVSSLSGITLWSPATPKLYDIRTTITGRDLQPHTVLITTGFREAKFQADGFYLNGQRLEIFGINRHQLFPYTGMAAPERLQRRDAELIATELNCNMVRCSHYPQSPYFLDACDELGLMVWEEPPGWRYMGDSAFQALVLQNVHDMIIRDRNRPSVIVWGTRLNETNNYPGLYAQARRLAYTLDGSRPTSGAMYTQSTTGWAEDVFGYDDYHSSGGEATLDPPVAGVPYLVTEAVGAIDGAPLYRWIDTEATLATQAQMHAQVHNIAQSDPAYAGLLGWAGIDYASYNGGDRVWNAVKWPGVLDTFRVPKPGAAFYRSQIDPAIRPVILPVFFWDFGPSSPPAGPGPGTMIATNCDHVELSVGGAYFATGTPDTTDYASLAYPPVFVDLTVAGLTELLGSLDQSLLPELRIDGYVGGQLVGSVSMSADPARDQLSLVIEDATIEAGGNDMTRMTFRALDAYGNQRPYPSGDVTLTLTGPATLIGDNPFQFATYGGVGGAFIRSNPGGGFGVVTVAAEHPTLGLALGTVVVSPASGLFL
jgi:beta-galactosidase